MVLRYANDYDTALISLYAVGYFKACNVQILAVDVV